VQKMWDKGLILASLVSGETLFPRRLALKAPSSIELANRFEEARSWISDLRRGSHYRVVMREVRYHIIGSNSIPEEIWIDTLDNALAFIGKSRDAGQFNGLVELIGKRIPALLPWLAKYPLKSLALAEDWPLLLDVIDWIHTHPRPGVYLRQIDVPGVHTKFIETHRAALSELLDLALPPDAIDTGAAPGPGRFCSRYGFLEKPLRIRFRILDPTLALLPSGADQDIAINQNAFKSISPEVSRVFITENEINFLAFPNLPQSMVIFGAGYGFEVLSQAEWLQRCPIHYWGDIDTHGFAILDQLRSHLPHAGSFLMNRETLMAHKHLWVKEHKPVGRELLRLAAEERSLFEDLRDDRIGHAVRLEQERIGFIWVRAALKSYI
jgi:hypothetical protein